MPPSKKSPAEKSTSSPKPEKSPSKNEKASRRPRKQVAETDTPPTTTAIEIIEPAQLPGFAKVDRKLLDDAVKKINELYIESGLVMCLSVGSYVLDELFGGDPEAFRSRSGKHATFRAIAEGGDLHMNFSTLYKSVAVAAQCRVLPVEVAEALSYSHHVLLLPLKDIKVKEEMARTAVKDELVTRELAEMVKAKKLEQNKGSRRGRPSIPAFVKAFTMLKKLREKAASETISAEVVASYSPKKTRTLLKDVEHWIKGLQETMDVVWTALDELEKENKKGQD